MPSVSNLFVKVGTVSSAARIPFPWATSAAAMRSRSWLIMEIPPACAVSYLPVLAGRLERLLALPIKAPSSRRFFDWCLSPLLLPGGHAVGHTFAKVGRPDDG